MSQDKQIVHASKDPTGSGPRIVAAEEYLVVEIRCPCDASWSLLYPVGTRTGATLDEINALPENAARIAVFKTPKHLCAHSEVSIIIGILPENN